ncbi:MAG: hypothetical protein KAH54_02170 [Candidatus Sabulitectum sp.]|nr:hypothetical protein [Candidatus Sabulitectum sp.]
MNKIVVHRNDGIVSKGYSFDFTPALPYFHLASLEDPTDSVKFFMDNLKAVFIVMDFAGDALHRNAQDFSEAPIPRRHIIVTFKDGEKFYGISELTHRNPAGFILFPADPESNTIRVYIPNTAIANVDVAE